MKLVLRLAAAVFAAAGVWLVVKLVKAAMQGDGALVWIIFTFVVGCFWIAVILVRGSGRPLK